MKKLLIALLVSLCFSTPALCQLPANAATKQDVLELLELTGTRQRILQLWSGMAQQAAISAAESYRRRHPNATPADLHRVSSAMQEYMQNSLKGISVDELINAVIPVYQRHLTHDDIQAAITFYKSGPGQRLLKETPAIMSESMQAAQPIIKKHEPQMEAQAEKMMEKTAKPPSAPAGTQSGATKPQ